MNAAPAAAEHLVVPLSDPAKPAELEVSLVMGSIKVTGGATNEVVIEASRAPRTRTNRHKEKDLPGDRAGMRRIPNTAIGLEAEEEGNKVSISAESWARAVDLEIQVPAGSTMRLSTVNDGDIEVEGIDGEVEVSNTNGEIRVKNVRGPVSATTVNGDVTVVFSAAMAAAPMAFSTLNGDVDVTLPARPQGRPCGCSRTTARSTPTSTSRSRPRAEGAGDEERRRRPLPRRRVARDDRQDQRRRPRDPVQDLQRRRPPAARQELAGLAPRRRLPGLPEEGSAPQLE